MNSFVRYGVRQLLVLIAISPSLLRNAQNLQLLTALPRTGTALATGNGDSYGAVISRNGRFVAFASAADNLVTDTNGMAFPSKLLPNLNVFLKDFVSGTTTLVSLSAAGLGGGNGDSLPV